MSGEAPAQRRPRPWLVLLPLALFAALAALFLAQLMSGRDVSAIPSALIGHPAPATALPPLEGTGLPGIDGTGFAGKVTVVNVWASWCVPCRDEHPHLMQLAGDPRFTLAGLNYKDKPENARRFLGELGNPFAAIGVDASGRAGIDWGVYGVPETFVVGRDGRIAWKHVGPFDDRSVREELMPQVEKALKGG
ncbi:MAG: DsbE family thiol:disulfide interchange protein [Rhizobiales bacterium]|nr:DsbE family thiol:disulfide interchange protein [Hyphomicrobiales bacterium]OJU32251.1 MAG: thiol:disulfide interchange protein [Rhizobiales bacterium 68-8]